LLKTIRHFLELIRFSHTLFALPFALLAAVMVWSIRPSEFAPTFDFATPFRWRDLLGILGCMVAARSAAMAFNRLVDRRIDAENPRTATRHIPAGTLSALQVAIFAALSSIAFVASTLFFLPNRLPLFLSVPVLLFLFAYSFMKRITRLAHFWLGAALALSPIAVWIALRGAVVSQYPADICPAWLLGGAVLMWVAGFDIIYACLDYDSDRRAGLNSVPAALGIPRALKVASLCHMAMFAFLICLPLAYPLFGWVYWLGVACIAALLIYEHRLVQPDDLSRVNAAFFNVNAVISLGLFAVGTLDLWLRHG
jgi:4-hydroxybenzoate polyprenyltransferase